MPLSLRALRHRWGIAAPRLTVRAHVAWPWRVLAVIAILSISLTLARWMYDAGRRFAGFDATALETEVATLRRRAADLEDEAERLRGSANSNESRLAIEKSAGAQLARQLKASEVEIVRLREDLAFFDNLAARGTGEDNVAVSRVKVENDALPGEYRYRVLLTQGGRKERDFNGRLQFVVSAQLRGHDVTLVIPDDTMQDGAAYRVSFRRFYRAEGSFKVDPSARVRAVQVRVFEQGADQPRAAESFSLL